MIVLERIGLHGVLIAALCTGALGCQSESSPPSVDDTPIPSGPAARVARGPATLAASVRPAPRPAGVPPDYVPTPNGYFHPSCIVKVEQDEVLGHDLVVRGLQHGEARRTLAPCAYPRYSARGRVIPQRDTEPRQEPDIRPKLTPQAAFYDGWLIAYWWNSGTLPPEATITGKWIVPPSPTGDPVTGSDPVTIYYFDDFEMEQGSAIDILQPVLGYGSPNGNQWTISSWNCCTSGIEGVSNAVDVNPGDVIEGITAGTNCDSSSVCQTWTVTTRDLTTGTSTVLSTTEPNAPNVVNSAVLEAYGVTACNMFPPGGEETFFDNTVTAGDGGVLSLSYYASAGPNTGSPACGYAGTSSGDSYTLIYSTTPTLIPTTTTLVPTPASTGFGGSVTLTAMVNSNATSPAMGGNVTFDDGTTSLGTVDVAGASSGNGTASLVVSTLAPGAHQLTATFSGDDGYQPSTSAMAAVTVARIPTTTTLAAAGATTVHEGTSVVVTATIAGQGASGEPAPTGSIAFTNGAASLGTMTLVPASAGTTSTASITLSDVAVYALGAAYSGDTDYAASSATLAATIASTVALSPGTASTTPGGALAFSATGNVGALSWTLKNNASGGSVDALGHYTAGAKGNVTDTIAVSDSLDGGATATVNVGAGGSGSGGSSGGGTPAGSGSDGGNGQAAPGGSSGGCGCSEAGRAPSGWGAGIAGLGVLLLVRRRRRPVDALRRCAAARARLSSRPC